MSTNQEVTEPRRGLELLQTFLNISQEFHKSFLRPWCTFARLSRNYLELISANEAWIWLRPGLIRSAWVPLFVLMTVLLFSLLDQVCSGSHQVSSDYENQFKEVGTGQLLPQSKTLDPWGPPESHLHRPGSGGAELDSLLNDVKMFIFTSVQVSGSDAINHHRQRQRPAAWAGSGRQRVCVFVCVCLRCVRGISRL